jgi:hypothetical protein
MKNKGIWISHFIAFIFGVLAILGYSGIVNFVTLTAIAIATPMMFFFQFLLLYGGIEIFNSIPKDSSFGYIFMDVLPYAMFFTAAYLSTLSISLFALVFINIFKSEKSENK